jgi:Exostosin family
MSLPYHHDDDDSISMVAAAAPEPNQMPGPGSGVHDTVTVTASSSSPQTVSEPGPGSETDITCGSSMTCRRPVDSIRFLLLVTAAAALSYVALAQLGFLYPATGFGNYDYEVSPPNPPVTVTVESDVESEFDSPTAAAAESATTAEPVGPPGRTPEPEPESDPDRDPHSGAESESATLKVNMTGRPTILQNPDSLVFTRAWTIPTFYVYDDPAITLAQELDAKCKGWDNGTQNYDTFADILFLQNLWDHPNRTLDWTEAELFVISIPLNRLCRYGNKCIDPLRRKLIHNAIAALTKHPAFNNGHNHFLLAENYRFSAWSNRKNIASNCEANSVIFKSLSNVAMGRYEVHSMTSKLCKRHPSLCNQKKWRNTRWGVSRAPMEMTRCAIIAPYGMHRGVANQRTIYPLTITWDNWNSRKYFVHYRNSGRASAWKATKLRRDIFAKGRYVPKGAFSAGPGSYTDFVKEMINSRFCLIPRGDTPTSHLIYDGIASGCIPVFIGDIISYVGLPFQGQVHWDAFSLQIAEDFMVEDPETAFRFIAQLPEARLKLMVDALAEAQHILWEVDSRTVTDLVLTQARHICGPGSRGWNAGMRGTGILEG